MKKLLSVTCAVAVALCLAASLTEAQAVPPGSAAAGAGPESKDPKGKHQSLVQRLKTLQEGMAAKQADLAKLRHKWTVSKGRTPTAEELKDFETKRAKGVVKAEDNPYVNKTPLSSPARARAAYYQKLAEIDKDRELSLRLEQEIKALEPVGLH